MREIPGIAVEFIQSRVAALRRVVMRDLEDLSRLIAHVLRGGVLLASGLLIAGLLVATIEGGIYPAEVLSPGSAFRSVLQLQPEGLLSMGVIALILTPVASVAVTLTRFLRNRDGTYVALTAIVLMTLFSGLLIWIT